MTADEYLKNILQREAVDTSTSSPVIKVKNVIEPIAKEWAGNLLVGVNPSGSFAKGTANDSGTDIDLFVSLSSNTSTSLEDIYNSLHSKLQLKGYSPRKQNVSLGIKVGNYDVDIIPAKRQDQYSDNHSLYRRKAKTWTKTNVTNHISLVRNSKRIDEIRIVKLWRNQKVIDFPSFL
jgi:tRNA nucleotidyltransferase (CCA-adding enzyme)